MCSRLSKSRRVLFGRFSLGFFITLSFMFLVFRSIAPSVLTSGAWVEEIRFIAISNQAARAFAGPFKLSQNYRLFYWVGLSGKQIGFWLRNLIFSREVFPGFWWDTFAADVASRVFVRWSDTGLLFQEPLDGQRLRNFAAWKRSALFLVFVFGGRILFVMFWGTAGEALWLIFRHFCVAWKLLGESSVHKLGRWL